MSKRALALVVVSALAACEAPQAYREYRAPRGEFSVDIPSDWTVFSNFGTKAESPIGYVFILPGEAPPAHGDEPGVRLAVYKLVSRRSDFTGDDAAFDKYRLEHLAPALDLFKQKLPQTSSATVSGQPARSFRQPYRFVPAPGQEDKAQDLVLEQTVLVRPEAVYMLEFRSPEKQRAAKLPLYERLLKSFKLGA